MDKHLDTKEVFVKAHVRIIKQRVYRFVCKQCNQVVERICYPSHPLYCSRCKPSKPPKQKPAPMLIKSKKKPKTKQMVSVNNDRGVAAR
ncbi:hypothetical protein QUB80_22355 [Chlorogloeopsis sp. ULAP01]|uniref:hypothetical protein n=1 Tax=Chlorogloeopsis sp. ULAP01 TaxID=3056483 RepID=UPI0025AB4E62|nr:hypothetical protein [Chlorogloeopsis sp. ULAP01]MDM9383435.1 hypothetical protein [Chlorogloeopsis sp. ULAP01]